MALLGVARVAVASTPTQPFSSWVTDGNVDSLVQSGNTLYVGGSFGYLGPDTGGAVMLSPQTGAVLSPYTPLGPVTGQFAGAVSQSISDGAGGYYISGDFTSVDGIGRNYLAHLRADGTLDTTFKPNPNGFVGPLALSGSTLYVGGVFTSIGGASRSCLAALNATTGRALPWAPQPHTVSPDTFAASVGAIAVSGSTVYVGGLFDKIGGQKRTAIAAVDATTGQAIGWNPSISGLDVEQIAVAGSTVYLAGNFNKIDGQRRSSLGSVDAASGAVTAWDPEPNQLAGIATFALSGSTLYAGGSFTKIDGQPRDGLAAFDTGTGALMSWDPMPTLFASSGGDVRSLAISGSTVYVAGSFNAIGGQSRLGLAAVDATSGAATSWNPNPDRQPSTVSVSGSNVFAGGNFNSVGGVARQNLAAVDATTLQPTAWNPGADGAVDSLTLDGSTLYATGSFQHIGGASRARLAALDTGTGSVTAWNPAIVGGVDTVAVSGSTVYLAGGFSQVDGQPRNNLAAVDSATGSTVYAWDPDSNGEVTAISIAANLAYIGGGFSQVGTQARTAIAAVDANPFDQGAPTSWDPSVVGSNGSRADVDTLEPVGPVVYIGGSFAKVGGKGRLALAAINASTGTATNWAPGATFGGLTGHPQNTRVQTISVVGSTVYVGGFFSQIGGQSRQNAAALSATTAKATSWDPAFDRGVLSIAASPSAVDVGGYFFNVNDLERGAIAAFPPS